MGFVALKFAPQSLVTPLGAISLITNLLIAPILHKQKPSYSDIIGVIIIVCGCVMITLVPGDTIEACFIVSLYLFIRFVEKTKSKIDQNVSKRNSILPSSKNDENDLSTRDNSSDLLAPSQLIEFLDAPNKSLSTLNNNENIEKQMIQ
ncbi:hypothetical protein C2G38_2050724 [Gigaspora rosea]|uniref:Magnesium transporter NIPA-domain-containing protein n=1 Tax=Gigaspora rosea TaxID=44941 RepID=A0A397TXN4_9GLOM|nr:hypothetical protein C2G38_2050724 [Gigaspora rosea]